MKQSAADRKHVLHTWQALMSADPGLERAAINGKAANPHPIC
jgi:hypothetical protein